MSRAASPEAKAFLPAVVAGVASPEIEEVLRRAAAHGLEALVEGMGRALSAICSRDVPRHLRACRFEHAGFHPTGQLP
jgi:hypothetical protein